MPELGGDSKLVDPVLIFAGGSTVNTAAHLRMLMGRQWDAAAGSTEPVGLSPSPSPSVVVQTMINPQDEYGQILLRHAEAHGFQIINCATPSSSSDSPCAVVKGTPHCVVIVSDRDRSFMTHRGCSKNFTAWDLQMDALIDTDGPVHFHVAGFFCTPGFGDGSLKAQLIRLRTERAKKWPNRPTTVSLVTQYDLGQVWDGGFDEIAPLLSCLIMNELEADKVLARAKGRPIAVGEDPTGEWISHFSALNPDAVVVVTQDINGAIAFRNEKIICNVGSAVLVDVVDPTGAGDSFTAGFLHGLWRFGGENADDWSDKAITRALLWGCAVGTASVTIRGASIPSTPEIIIGLYEEQQQHLEPITM